MNVDARLGVHYTNIEGGFLKMSKAPGVQILVLRVAGADKILEVEHLLNGKPDPIVASLFGTHILPSPLFDVDDFKTMLDYAEELKARQPEPQIEIVWNGIVTIVSKGTTGKCVHPDIDVRGSVATCKTCGRVRHGW